MGSSLRMMRVIDSHTASQPTRVVVDGGPDLGDGPLDQRLQRFRSATIEFGRSSSGSRAAPTRWSALFFALRTIRHAPPVSSFSIAATISACAGTASSASLPRSSTSASSGDTDHTGSKTPVGVVTAQLHASGDVSFQNVASFRHKSNVTVDVDGSSKVTGDVAWGGNWFFSGARSSRGA